MAYTDFTFTVYRNTRKRFEVTFTRGTNPLLPIDPSTNPAVPFDLTGCTIWCTGKDVLSEDDDEAVFQSSTLDGQIVLTNLAGTSAATAGKATITISPIDTVHVETQTLCFTDVQVRDTNGAVDVVLTGMVTVELHPTQEY